MELVDGGFDLSVFREGSNIVVRVDVVDTGENPKPYYIIPWAFCPVGLISQIASYIRKMSFYIHN